MTTTFSKASFAEDDALLVDLGVARQRLTGGTLAARSPISGEVVAEVQKIDLPGRLLFRTGLGYSAACAFGAGAVSIA
jgi:hypothetical protein